MLRRLWVAFAVAVWAFAPVAKPLFLSFPPKSTKVRVWARGLLTTSFEVLRTNLVMASWLGGLVVVAFALKSCGVCALLPTLFLANV